MKPLLSLMSFHIKRCTISAFCCHRLPLLETDTRVATKMICSISQKSSFPISSPIPACQGAAFKMAGWCHAAVWWLLAHGCVTVTRCARLHHSFPTSQINQTLFRRGHRSSCLHLTLFFFFFGMQCWGMDLEADGEMYFNLSLIPNPALRIEHSSSAYSKCTMFNMKHQSLVS